MTVHLAPAPDEYPESPERTALTGHPHRAPPQPPHRLLRVTYLDTSSSIHRSLINLQRFQGRVPAGNSFSFETFSKTFSSSIAPGLLFLRNSTTLLLFSAWTELNRGGRGRGGLLPPRRVRLALVGVRVHERAAGGADVAEVRDRLGDVTGVAEDRSRRRARTCKLSRPRAPVAERRARGGSPCSWRSSRRRGG